MAVADIQTRPFVNYFPLHDAVQQNRPDDLSQLIAAGESVNLGTFDSVTPLHDACLAGRLECVKILIEAGATINARNIDGATPLCDAANNGDVTCVRLLLQHGAEPNPQLCLTSPLHEAVGRDHTEVVQILLAGGANINSNDLHFGTPLHLAAYKNNIHSAAVLLCDGAHVNAVKMHQTPLHVAARNNNVAMVALLLDHGGHILARNNWGKTPRDLVEPITETARLLHYWEKNVPSLVQLCRLAVRRAVKPRQLRQLADLDLPPVAAAFLQYSEWRPLSDSWRTSCSVHIACSY